MAKKDKTQLGLEGALSAVAGSVGVKRPNIGGQPSEKIGRVALLAAIVSGEFKIKKIGKTDLNRIEGIKLGKLNYTKKDLAKLGLSTKDISQEDFQSLKKELRGYVQSGDNLTRKELKGFKKSARAAFKAANNARINNTYDRLQDNADDNVPDVLDNPQVNDNQMIDITGYGSRTFGFLGTLQAGFDARRRQRQTRGVRATIGTGFGGDRNYGKSLARVSVG